MLNQHFCRRISDFLIFYFDCSRAKLLESGDSSDDRWRAGQGWGRSGGGGKAAVGREKVRDHERERCTANPPNPPQFPPSSPSFASSLSWELWPPLQSSDLYRQQRQQGRETKGRVDGGRLRKEAEQCRGWGRRGGMSVEAKWKESRRGRSWFPPPIRKEWGRERLQRWRRRILGLGFEEY